MCDIDPLELHDSASEDEKETQLVKSFNNLTPPSSNDSLISSSSKGLRQPEAVVGFCIKCKTKKATLHVRQTSYCQPCFLETHQSKLQHQLRKLWKPTLLFTPSSSSSSGSLKKMKETWSTDTRSWSSSPSFHPTMGLEATKKYNEGDEDEAIERKARFPLPSKVVVHVQDTLASWVLIQGLLQSYPWEKEAWCRLKSHSTTSSSSSASSSFLVTFVYIHAPEVGPLDSEGSTSSHEPMGGGAFNVGQFHRWFSSSRVQQTKNPSLTTAAPFSSMVQFLAIPLAHVLQLTTVRKWMKTVFCNNQLGR
ncbi:hypothetical protein HMI54_000724 [Coelomomyces lativittatus]|nr:hypothetical protein HMI55_001675 [Coelomomyces lativittatus]KAJ1511565.1 hypothetical protein HMI54_000724 [Coelomomyces lativittatus]